MQNFYDYRVENGKTYHAVRPSLIQEGGRSVITFCTNSIQMEMSSGVSSSVTYFRTDHIYLQSSLYRVTR